MAIYYVKDLLDRLHELFRQGCEYVELNSDDASLSLTALPEKDSRTLPVRLESCPYGKGTDSDSDDDNCYELQFSYDEIATIASALANMPAIYEKALSDDGYDPREKEAFRSMYEKMLQLKNKMEQAFR